MRTMKYQRFFCLLILAALGCKKSLPDNDTQGAFNQEKLKSHSLDYCPSDEVLTEIQTPSTIDFEDLADNVRIFGFHQGSDVCALRSDIHNSFPFSGSTGHFDLTSTGQCVPNGSLWKVTSTGVTSPDSYLDLQSLDLSPKINIHIFATRDLPGSYARDHAGLRRFACKLK